jgi:hypothetical protein
MNKLTAAAALAFMLCLFVGSLFVVPSGAQGGHVPVTSSANVWTALNTFTAGIISELFNGTPEADQFSGSDPSVKIRAAEIYAIAHNLPVVDATHFTGTLACSVDMFGALNATPEAAVNLTVNLPSAHFQCTIPQTVTNSFFTINGQGPGQTQIEYTGTTTSSAMFQAVGPASGVDNGVTDVHINGIFFYGDTNLTGDVVLVRDVNRSEFHNISTWGGTGAAFHCEGCVTDTFNRLAESQIDAALIGAGSSTTPQFGLELDSSSASGNQTTDGTVIDNRAEITASAGWWLRSANSMTFTSGTAEDGLRGIVVSAGSKWNTFISSDIEGNSQNTAGVDVHDSGQSNTYIGLLATSACSACNSLLADGGAASLVIWDTGLSTGTSGLWNIIGNNQNFQASEGETSLWTLLVAGNADIGGPLQVPILVSTSPSVSFFPGTGITSITCADPSTSGGSCSNMRGTMKVINSSATTVTSFAQISFGSTLGSKPVCRIDQQQGPNWLGLYVSAVSTTSFDIANANTLSGTGTFYITYECTL